MIITDKDLALKNSLSHIFPMSRQQLYIFYINKNIALNIKYKYQDSRNPDTINIDDKAVESPLHNDKASNNFNLNDFMYISICDYLVLDNVSNTPVSVYELWKAIVFTATEKSFNLAQERLQTLNRPSIIVYIERYFFPWKDQQAYCYINRYYNFDQRTTSSTKVSYRALKAYLMKETSTFFRLYEIIRTILTNINTTFEAEVDRQATYIQLKYMGQPQLRRSTHDISYRSVNLLVGEKRIVIRYVVPTQRQIQTYQPLVLPLCTSRFRTQYNILCYHELISRLINGQPLKKTD